MNTLTEDSLITPDSAAPPAPDSNVPSDGTPPGPYPAIPRRRRKGKIASLPLPIRDQINHLIQDGVPYQLIIDKLEAPGAPPLPCVITENNLSDWKDGGYLDWLDDQFWRDEMRARHETFSGLFNGADPIQLPEGGLQLAAIGLCELLRDLSTSAVAGKPDPEKYVRAANSLARLSRSILTLQQYRNACAEAQAKVRELKDPKRKLTEDERRAIILQVDEILGIGTGGQGGC